MQSNVLNDHRHFLSFMWYSLSVLGVNSLPKGCATQSTAITALLKQPQVLHDLMMMKGIILPYELQNAEEAFQDALDTCRSNTGGIHSTAFLSNLSFLFYIYHH